MGATLGYALHGRVLGRLAAAVGAAASLLPDADVFIRSAADPLVAVEVHRGFSHSLIFAPVGAAVAAAPFLLLAAARAHWRALWTCALASYVTHCLLDAATSYGTNLFWPLSTVRVGWDFISVIDPPVTLILLIGMLWALLARRRAVGAIALVAVGGYIGLGAVQHARASAAQAELARIRGHERERFEVMPTLGNLMVWRALYLHEGRIYSDRLRVGLAEGPRVVEGWSLPWVGPEDLTADEQAASAARNSFARFSHFSDHWVARSPDDPTVLGDMRYSLSAGAFDPIWGVRFGPPGTDRAVEWVNRSTERRVDPAGMWAEIVGRDARYRPLPAAPGAAD
jgi:inner membrane protein